MKKLFLYVSVILAVIAILGLLANISIFNVDKDSIESSSFETNDSLESDSNIDSETEAESEISYNALTYSAIGDSITYGFCGDHSKPAFSNNYPSCVKSYLGLKQVNNYGACGCLLARSDNASYTSMVDKINLISEDVNIISVFGGINDFVGSVPLGDIYSNDEYTIYGALNSIANKLTNQHSDAFIFFITPLPLAESNLSEIDNTEYTIEDVCIAIKEVGAKWDIPVYDANTEAGFNPDVHSFDGCHPTEAYYSTIFAPKVAEFIRQNYRGK